MQLYNAATAAQNDARFAGARTGVVGGSMRPRGTIAAGMALAGALLVSPLGATAQTAHSAQPSPLPSAAESAAHASAPPHGASAQTHVAWSPQEIAAARARCTMLLTGLDAVVLPADSIKEGDCGAPAPVQLLSIGRSPPISLSPPPAITCDLAATLTKWVQEDVQPAAREILGGPVIRLEVMSGYSCRNAYARAGAKLSEHGRANALDISRFITERGEGAAVAADWGMTERDSRLHIAAAQAAASEPSPDQATAQTAIRPAGDGLRGSMALHDTTINQGSTLGLLPVRPGIGTATTSPALGLNGPNRLGGPRPEPGGQAARERFLHRIHAAACRWFGTVLGPEANEAHRNHFHIDKADRQGKSFCE